MGRGARVLPGLTMVAVTLALAGCGTSADPIGHLHLVTRTSLLPPSTVMGQMSCPSAHLCVAEDTSLSATSTMYSTNPGVGSSWKYLPDPAAPGGRATFGAYQITCPSTRLCLDIGNTRRIHDAKVFAIHDLDRPHPHWKLVGGGGGHTWPAGSSLSCPTAGFCAELAEGQTARDGTFWVSTNPGAPDSWHKRSSPPGARELPLGGTYVLFCASAQLCLDVVATGKGDRVMSIRNPLSNASRWHPYPLPLLTRDEYVQAGHCDPSGACIMVVNGAHTGSILTTPNAQGGPSTWSTSNTTHGLRFMQLAPGGCFANGSCYTTAGLSPAKTSLMFSEDPFRGTHSSWQSVRVFPVATCATPQTCFSQVPAPHSSSNIRVAVETIHLTR
jgi:hypothetical protein